MQVEHLSAKSVRVRARLSREAWDAFEALATRYHPVSRESLFELVVAQGLNWMKLHRDADDKGREAA